MNNRTNFLASIIVFASFMIGCGDSEISEMITIEMQQEADSIAIAEFINQKGLDVSALDTTQSGVIYQVLDTGMGTTIEYGDIVSLYLSIKQTDGTLLRTNIDTVLQNSDLYDSTAVFNSLIISHTQTGWALGPPESNFLGLQGFTGMREGMTAVLSEMNVGGRAMFITPSLISMESGPVGAGTYPTQEVFVFHVYPTRVQ